MMRIALFQEKKDSSTKIGALQNSQLGIENETFDSSKKA
jgi:hypothetical protein